MCKLSSPAAFLPFALAALLVPAPPAAASTPNTGPKPWDSNFANEGAPPSAVTDHLKCVITEVRDNRVVQIWDEASQSRHLIRIAENVPIKARQKARFAGRKQIAFADLEVGHRIKVTYLTGDGSIVRVKVIDRTTAPPDPSGT